MVWLDICDEQGNAFYFDIHHVERRRVERRWRHSVSGTCGNGLVEMEVLVEPGGQGEVTFVDLSVGTAMHDQLLSGIDSLSLETGLLEAAKRHCGLSRPQAEMNEPYPHIGRPMNPLVVEPGPTWRSIG